MNWLQVYERAQEDGVPLAGYYHHNIRTRVDDRDVIVRIPISGADKMDLRLWTETEILAAIGTHIASTPKLVHVEDDPPFQIHEFIDGPVLNELAPRGTPVPSHVLTDVVRLFADLAVMPASQLPALPVDWPTERDTAGFAMKIAADSRRVFDQNRLAHRTLYQQLGIPSDPFETTDAAWYRFTERPLSCVHSDVHRKNVIVQGNRCYFLDWELALYGDPVYELAVHLHKTAYLPHERSRLIEMWQSAMPPAQILGFERDLQTYLIHEQIKSTLVDSVRYADAFAGAPAPYPLDKLAEKLVDMLTTARRHWHIIEPVNKLEIAGILAGYADHRAHVKGTQVDGRAT